MEFQCKNPLASLKADRNWTGKVNIVHRGQDSLEIDITGKGSRIYAVVGHCRYGNYICIPSWNIGCELADFRDTFWNSERLEKQLGISDAITISYALKSISELL